MEKLTTPLGELVPEPKGLVNWSKDVSFIPEICDDDIYNYLVLEKGASSINRRDHPGMWTTITYMMWKLILFQKTVVIA